MTIPEDRRTSLDVALGPSAGPGPSADPAHVHAPCSSCGLTSAGDEALRRELDRLADTSPEGGWHAELCAECGGVCLVVDHDEDWVLGVPPVGPVMVTGPGPRPGAPEPPDPEPSLLPPLSDQEPFDPRAVVRDILTRTSLKPAGPPSEK